MHKGDLITTKWLFQLVQTHLITANELHLTKYIDIEFITPGARLTKT